MKPYLKDCDKYDRIEFIMQQIGGRFLICSMPECVSALLGNWGKGGGGGCHAVIVRIQVLKVVDTTDTFD
jgi:hypothetical protein